MRSGILTRRPSRESFTESERKKNMQYAIELYFDQETETALFRLAQRVAEEKLSTKFMEWKTRPHLTLACFHDKEKK